MSIVQLGFFFFSDSGLERAHGSVFRAFSPPPAARAPAGAEAVGAREAVWQSDPYWHFFEPNSKFSTDR